MKPFGEKCLGCFSYLNEYYNIYKYLVLNTFCQCSKKCLSCRNGSRGNETRVHFCLLPSSHSATAIIMHRIQIFLLLMFSSPSTEKFFLTDIKFLSESKKTF